MSFILDALKKAESERHRHVAPVLMDARVAPPRRGLPAWAWVLGAVLLVNLVLLGWILWRAPSGAVQAAAAAAPAPESPPAASVAPPDPMRPPAPSPSPAPAGIQNVAPVPALPAAPPPRATAAAADASSLPTLQELRNAGVALPDLQLYLHVYDPAPARRSVLLDGMRLREGEYTPNGVKVEQITATGVVLEAVGRRFRLEAGN